jgi:flavin-dependent dehydrogenase
MSREVFDAELVREAMNVGVASCRDHSRCRTVPRTVGRWCCGKRPDRRIVAEVVLAADGLGSARCDGFSASGGWVPDVADDGPAFYGDGVIHMACGHGGYAGLVRLEDGRLDVAAAADAPAVQRHGGLGPSVAAAVAEADWPPVPAGAVGVEGAPC